MRTDTILAELLLRWEELQEQGQEVSAEELAAEHPHLLDELTRQIRALQALRWVEQPDTGRSTDTPAGGRSVATPTTEPPPTLLAGRYRLERLIAEGGFGRVWQGHDVQTGKRVAVKVARPQRVASAEQQARFREEAQRAGRLRHPGIVPVHDAGQEGEAYFLVSDLIDGADLAERLRHGRPTVTVAARLVAEVARQLQHAHEQGIIHRDLKPANLLVDEAGRVFLTDFGIAVTREQLLQTAVDCSGTLAYMAPEQATCDSRRIDARSDVYSLGVILYELLVGRPPFQARHPSDLRAQVLYLAPRPPRDIDAGVPLELQRICLRCLAKAPAERYPTAQALADDLEDYLRSTAQEEPSAFPVTF